jgi:nucleoside-diphosphate-sugar epimerase
MGLSTQDLIEEKVIVAGGTGHIGSRVVRKLVAEGVNPQNIRVIYYPGSSTSAIDDLPVELYPQDILDKETLPKAVEGCKYVFDLIGNTAMHNKSRKIQWMVNVEGTRNLLEMCEGAEKIVYTSTVDALGFAYPKGSLGDETTSPYVSENPQIGKEVPKTHMFDSPEETLEFADAIHEGTAPKKWWKKIKIGYHDSKLAAEEIVNRLHHDTGLPVTCVLPGLNFGPGDDFIGSGTYLLRVMIKQMVIILQC